MRRAPIRMEVSGRRLQECGRARSGVFGRDVVDDGGEELLAYVSGVYDFGLDFGWVPVVGQSERLRK
jgi:hypothetical protein